MSLSGTQPYNVSKVITKSDTVNYDGSTYSAAAATKAIPADAVLVGGAGNIYLVLEDNTILIVGAAAGQIIPIKTIRVNSTTTTATNMYALYYV